MEAFRVAWLYFRMGVLNELHYRANFFIQVLQSAVAVGVAIAVLALVYSHTDNLNGWTRSELLVVMGIQILLGGAIRTSIQPNMERLMEEVRDGKLDFALTKPIDAQLLASVREVRFWRAVDVLSGAAVAAAGIVGLERGVGLGDALLFVAMLAIGATMIYCFWLVLATWSFWVVRMHSTMELFEGVYQTGRFPVGIYPTWLRYGVTFLVPIGFAVTVPAEAVTSRLEWPTVLLAVGFGAALFAFTRWFWRFGLRRYSGASA
jgi:ABC-2 type transport system permease protein